jgi:hypothetical protein
MIQTKKLPGRKRNRPLKDYTGQRFGRLVATGLRERRNDNDHIWSFRCDCGVEVDRKIRLVRSGRTSSCGCVFREKMAARNTKHGQSGTKTYRVWKNMRARCGSETDSDYHLYGGRGIKVCERWQDYLAFVEDMGECPPGKSLDRVDVNAGYSPDNCRWATAKEQAGNKRTTRRVEALGQTKIITEWARELGVSHRLIDYRLKAGWPADEAVTRKPGGGHLK